MEGGEKRHCNEISGGRLSYLPDCLVRRIFSYLPLGDMVRTSALSREWRHYWKETQVLKFGRSFYEDFIKDKNCHLGVTVVSVISRLDSPVRQFEIFIPASVRRMKASGVRRWIPILSQNGVEVLSIHASNNMRRLFRLPSPIFDCSHLTQLSLTYCRFEKPGNFGGFSNLFSLCLRFVEIDDGLLEILICKSPKLESLSLEFDIGGHTVVVDAPLLKTLHYVTAVRSRALRMEDCQHLTSATIDSEVEFTVWDLEESLMDQLFSVMPKIVALDLGGPALSSLTEGEVPEKLAADLHNLRKLRMTAIDIASPKMLSSALCLIKSSPNLKSLFINFEDSEFPADHDEDAALQYLEAKLRDKIQVASLEFSNSRGSDYEISFMRKMIEHCAMLKTVHIIPHANIESEAQARMVETFSGLPSRISVRIEIAPEWRKETPHISYKSRIQIDE